MSKSKKLSIDVLGTSITVLSQNDEDYISLTDMLKAKDGDFFIADWLRNRNTVEFLGIWERVHNPGFNYGEFATIKSQAGLNSYRISVKDWVSKTNARGLRATTGRYGGTYAHKDIAFEFGMWISAEFKVYLIVTTQLVRRQATIYSNANPIKPEPVKPCRKRCAYFGATGADHGVARGRQANAIATQHEQPQLQQTTIERRPEQTRAEVFACCRPEANGWTKGSPWKHLVPSHTARQDRYPWRTRSVPSMSA